MDKLIEVMKQDFDELHTTRKIQRARKLKHDTGMHVNHNEYPCYFFGDPNAKLVLVHLNPKQQDNHSEEYEGLFDFKSFDEYVNAHKDFGKIRYRNSNSKSAFDQKQVEFLEPFNLIDLSSKNEFVNLEKVISDKLQLELIPFGASNFITSSMRKSYSKNPKILQSYIDLVLDTIISRQRDYVIFCGGIFEELLQSYTIDKKKHSFMLQKKDGSLTAGSKSFSNITLDYEGQILKVGIAHTFSQRSLNGSLMNRYGQKCCELYDQYS